LRLTNIKDNSLQKQEVEKRFENDIRENELLIYKVCRIYAFTDEDREDLFQDIIIQLWKAYPKFKGQSKFSTWLYRVALNTAITGLRRHKRIIKADPHGVITANIIDVKYDAGEEERLQQLYTAIEQLGQVEKAIVMLYMEDRPYEEMEEILGISQVNIRVKMTRLKDKLRQLTKNK
jgi:RNA polymerase sigma-70 factor, ECF subfamily